MGKSSPHKKKQTSQETKNTEMYLMAGKIPLSLASFQDAQSNIAAMMDTAKVPREKITKQDLLEALAAQKNEFL